MNIELEVLSFNLVRPTHISVGATYFSPVQYSYFDENNFWNRMEAEFQDMRAHNFNCVQFTGIRMDDYSRLSRAFSVYKTAGFENAIYFLEAYGAMRRLQRDFFSPNAEQFYAKYREFVCEFIKEAQERNWPPVIINFGDEFTNTGSEEFGASVAKTLRSIPGVFTGADADGYREVYLMAPLVDIVAFNQGWDGPQGVNKGRRLLQRETCELIRKAGATPWLVNIGVDRYTNGFWLWKMAQWGVRGKIEWIYRSYNGMPHNSFDANPLSTQMAYPGPGGTTIPSLDYEWMRIGLDDLAYVYTLEQRIRETRGISEKADALSEADEFLRRLSDEIEEDMREYNDQKKSELIKWSAEKMDKTRDHIIDLIVGLN